MRKKNILAVLTGDVVNSRIIKDKTQWLERLKEILHFLSQEEQQPLKWEVYRGDSFQVEWQQPEHVLRAALLIRSGLRALPEFYKQGADVRIAIGIGQAGHETNSVRESDGEAYQLSGLTLDQLNESGQKIKISTAWEALNESMAASLPLVETLMNDWSQPINEIAYYRMMHPEMTQKELAEQLSLTQPTINWRLAKSHIELILNFESYFRNQLKALCHAE
ncbi:SatD family protein [Pontibacter oryzae]|uniref:Winged helix-turn-helix transcriptional regulator n=1 Tax=Pontibacter oryzae TaxID=2304593 RepID=A0A399SGG4_9BACT|nr:SatD family protein [Pontibacter oryzae]RIJ41643.1 winged helix-turn-helix transcriptional regulator [Pontibacter oryzae]